MRGLNRHRIAPRVLVLDARAKHNSKPLSKVELDALVSAIQKSGVENGFNRLMDDAVRMELDSIALEL